MISQIFSFGLSPWNLFVRAVVVYLSVLLLLRISGKRELGQMSATDFVAILLISNAVQNSMNGGDTSLGGGLFVAGVIISLSVLISYLTYRSRIWRTLFEGTPTLLIHNGKIIHKHLHRERMSENELVVLLRKQGIHEIKILESAILEADGTLSCRKFAEREHPGRTES